MNSSEYSKYGWQPTFDSLRRYQNQEDFKKMIDLILEIDNDEARAQMLACLLDCAVGDESDVEEQSRGTFPLNVDGTCLLTK